MKKYLIVVLFTQLLIPIASAQATDKQITDIEKLVKEIKNNIPNYQVLLYTKDSTSKKSVYKQNKILKLIVIETQSKSEGKTIHKKVEWYFANNHMIYTEQAWTDMATQKLVDNQKCYLNDKHLIAWIRSNESIDHSSTDFKNLDTELITFGNELIENNK